MFLGWPESIEVIKKRHQWHYVFLEKKINNNWEMNITTRAGDPDEDLQSQKDTLKELIEDGRTSAWIHPIPPGLLAMTAGYYAALFAGNLVVRLISFL
jgi:hypothetical protein